MFTNMTLQLRHWPQRIFIFDTAEPTITRLHWPQYFLKSRAKNGAIYDQCRL